jgi:hypothetical protein
VLTFIRHRYAALIFLFFMLGSIPSLRAELAFDFIAETSCIVVPVINGHGPYRFLIDKGAKSNVREHTPQTIATTGRIITISATDRTMMVSGSLPLRTGKEDQPKRTSSVTSASHYTVVTTGDTVFQDGADAIRFEDFKSGETISIHGVLKGTTLTASRLAKWE